MKKLTKEQLQLIEEAKYGVSAGIYDESDLAFYADQLKMKLTEVKNLVGIKNMNENFLKSVGAPKVTEEAMQPAIDSLHEMTHGRMVEATKELLKGGKAKCIYEKWIQEGFLTEDTCSEDIAEEMMKDADICAEMYESCMGVNECGEGGDSWMQTRAGAKGQVFESDDEENTELPVPVNDEPEGHELGGEEDNPEDVVKLDVPLLIRLLEFAKENAETDVDLHKLAEHLVEITAEDPDRVLSIDDYEQILQDLAELDPEDQPNEKEPDNDSDDTFGFDDNEITKDEEGEQLAEGELPNFEAKKGSNIDSENEKAEEDTMETAAKDVDAQSKTTEEKVENLRNQKHNASKEDQGLIDKFKGKSPADVTLDTEDPQYEQRIKMEMETGDSRERDENVVGPKANVGDGKVFTITPDGKDVGDSVNGGEEEFKKHKERKKTDYFASDPIRINTRDKSGAPINEADQKIDRMKELMNFDTTKPSKIAKINEDIDFIAVYNKFKKNAKK